LAAFFDSTPTLDGIEKKLVGTSVEGRAIEYYQFGT
jgi:hypothetical protein